MVLIILFLLIINSFIFNPDISEKLDIKILNKLIDDKINYGLEINQSLLIDFKNKIQHFDYIYVTGINIINEFFILDNKLNSKISKNLFKILNKNKIFKEYSTIFADKGININY